LETALRIVVLFTVGWGREFLVHSWCTISCK
jgi:hypothetical protein